MPLKIKRNNKKVIIPRIENLLAGVNIEDTSTPVKTPIKTKTEITSTDTQTTPLSNVFIANSKEKKRPADIIIKNKKEPSVSPNTKYSTKQSYRRYKTKIEPNLKSKLTINEDDDVVKAIKEAFGIKRENTNLSKVEASPFEANNAVFENPELNKSVPSKWGSRRLETYYSKIFDEMYYDLSTDKQQELDDRIRMELSVDMDYDEKIAKLIEYINDYGNFVPIKTHGKPLKTVKEATEFFHKLIENAGSSFTQEKAMEFLAKLETYVSRGDGELNRKNFPITKQLLREYFTFDDFEISDFSKDDEEDLLQQKMENLNLQGENKNEDEAILNILSPLSPHRTEISGRTTFPAERDEITLDNLLVKKRGRGRPATRAETILKQENKEAIKNFQISRQINKDKPRLDFGKFGEDRLNNGLWYSTFQYK